MAARYQPCTTPNGKQRGTAGNNGDLTGAYNPVKTRQPDELIEREDFSGGAALAVELAGQSVRE